MRVLWDGGSPDLEVAQSVHRRQIPGVVLLAQLAECCLARRCRLPIRVAELQAERTVMNDLSVPRHEVGAVFVQLEMKHQGALAFLGNVEGGWSPG